MTLATEDLFRTTLKDELLEAWKALRAEHPGERFYSFGVDIGACAEYMIVTASTDEGLAQTVARYVDKEGGDPAEHETALRWSTGDSPLQDVAQRFLSRARELRNAGADPNDESPEAEAWITLAFEAAAQGLAALDSQGVFGTDLERSRLVLSIWGDQPDEERLSWVRSLNPPRVADRFARELEQGNEAALALWKARR